MTDNFTKSERTHADSQRSTGRHRGQGALGYRHDIWFVDDRGFLRSCLEQAVFRHHAVFPPHTVFRLPIAHESTLLETTDARHNPLFRQPSPSRESALDSVVAMSTSEIATVLAWHDALNSQDVDTLLQLSSDDIEVGGPKGASQGLAALREWATNAGITLVPGKMYVHHGVVVVEQTATWAAEPDKSATLASAFRVVADQVTSTFRHPDLATALAATDLSENDLVSDN